MPIHYVTIFNHRFTPEWKKSPLCTTSQFSLATGSLKLLSNQLGKPPTNLHSSFCCVFFRVKNSTGHSKICFGPWKVSSIERSFVSIVAFQIILSSTGVVKWVVALVTTTGLLFTVTLWKQLSAIGQQLFLLSLHNWTEKHNYVSIHSYNSSYVEESQQKLITKTVYLARAHSTPSIQNTFKSLKCLFRSGRHCFSLKGV